MKRILYALLLLIGSAAITLTSYGQITVADTLNPNELASFLAGPGVTVSNVTLNCPGGASGVFDGTNSNVNINRGVVLTSGQINNVVGPNNQGGAGTDNLSPGDFDLDAVVTPNLTFDACVLEFDITVESDSIFFNYVFGSEEYLEFVFAGFNDAFALFISGPGIVGQENIAIVPNVGIPVSIDNVNDVINPQYYVDNGDGFTSPMDTDSMFIQYDGFTTVLAAERGGLQPCATYHLKLAVADVGDGILDSGVFIERGSIVSAGVTLSTETAAGSSFSNAVEGCNDGIIIFNLETENSDSVVVNFQIAGTAQNGVDYATIPDSVVIQAGDSVAQITIQAFNDGMAEGVESVVIYLLSQCSGLPYDSVVIHIQDSLIANAITQDDAICLGDTVRISAFGGLNYSWSPNANMTHPDSNHTFIYPSDSTLYDVTVWVGPCTSFASVSVDVIHFDSQVDAQPGQVVCFNESVQLQATTFSNDTFAVYTWVPPGAVSDTNGQTTTTMSNVSGQYVVEITTANGCFLRDSIEITFDSLDISPWFVDTTIDLGDMVELGVDVVLGGTANLTYQWTPSTYIADATDPSPLITPQEDISYLVLVDNGVCTDTARLTVHVELVESPIAIPDAFTPNGDGNNDVFEVLVSGLAEVKSFQIFNRWGELLHDSLEPWDGKFEGEEQPVGTYVYSVVVGRQFQVDEVIQGSFSLIR